MVRIIHVSAFVYRYPIKVTVQTAFGQMRDRPMTLVRLRDADGVEGWGEIWCNFPAITAEYRASIVTEILGQYLIGHEFESPADLSHTLTVKTALLALQSNEHGPFQSAIAGVDIAAYDLFSRKASQPLCTYLGKWADKVSVYASGIGPEKPAETVDLQRQQGFSVYKLKVGFDRHADLANIESISKHLLVGEKLAIDANQGWKLSDAKSILDDVKGMGLAWVEEPIRADSPTMDWLTLRDCTSTSIAAGENLSSRKQFDEVVAERLLDIVQPDIAKWGGVTLGRLVAQDVVDAGLSYYPHYLGGGVGLAASAHLLAVVGGDGMLEVDSNPNPLREIILKSELNDPSKGYCMSNEPGLGVIPDLEALEPYLKGEWRCTA